MSDAGLVNLLLFLPVIGAAALIPVGTDRSVRTLSLVFMLAGVRKTAPPASGGSRSSWIPDSASARRARRIAACCASCRRSLPSAVRC